MPATAAGATGGGVGRDGARSRRLISGRARNTRSVKSAKSRPTSTTRRDRVSQEGVIQSLSVWPGRTGPLHEKCAVCQVQVGSPPPAWNVFIVA